MKLTKISNKDNKLVFSVENTTPAFVNTLRRTIIDEVPTMAIEDVEFRQNSSALYDEMIALRLGLLVLSTDLDSYQIPTEEEKDTARTVLGLTLSVKGPKMVYASDLKSKDPKVKPVFQKTPIVKLLEGQELELDAKAILGKGKHHTKWSPAHAYYRHDANITINNSSEFFQDFKGEYPQDIFKDGKIDKSFINSDKLIDAVDGVNEDIIKVEKIPDKFVFTVESWGQLSPEDVVLKAIEHIKYVSDDFAKSVKSL